MDVPPWQTMYSHFQRWNWRGVTDRILTELREQVRLGHGRQPEPTAGIIGVQSVRAADTVHRDTAATTAGKGTLEFVHKLADQQGFVVHCRRWVVEGPWPG
ncbi:hypothetical protein [Salinispora arenicola]|uniref:hypothetical protein n=1 Tax=Salinispora arenicola TaxID=168697 RepID=UPI0027DD7BA0|nr:hypothetical protein [Salinispora arenicola]